MLWNAKMEIMLALKWSREGARLKWNIKEKVRIEM